VSLKIDQRRETKKVFADQKRERERSVCMNMCVCAEREKSIYRCVCECALYNNITGVNIINYTRFNF